MANTPFDKIEDTTLMVNIKIDGSDIKDIYGIQSININHAVNKISTASIVLMGDVNIDLGEMEITDSDDFDPGKAIEKGIIVKHIVRLDTEMHFSFTIECKHEAVKMTYSENDRFFENKTDAVIIKSIAGEYNINCNVESSSEQYEITFQKMMTDWDFIIARCALNGFIITLDDNAGMLVNAPQLAATAVLTIETGVSMMAFDGALSAEYQPTAVNTSAWDAKTVSMLKASAVEPAMNKQGNIIPKNLPVKLPQTEMNLVSPAPITTKALATWANSILLRKRLAAFTGNVKFIGNAAVKTGSIIEIKGVGKKLNGDAFVTAVTHTIDSENWSTTVAFGLDDKRADKNIYLNSRSNAALGLQLATVTKIEEDPVSLYRIQIEIPSAADNPNYTWARMAHSSASAGSGSFFLPEVGDEVVFGFLDNDTAHPVILGSLYNGKNAAAYTATAKNDMKAFVTRSKMKLEFDEEKKSISLSTPGNNSIVISDDAKFIEMKDQHNNSITLNAAGISINSAGDVKINAKQNIEMKATAQIKAAATANLALQGLAVNINAQTQLVAKGTASAEFSAAGETTIKGAIVMIN
jgi:Rhs element Vgr protein